MTTCSCCTHASPSPTPSRRRRALRRAGTVSGLVAGSLLVGGIAYAVWSSTGGGSGAAAATSMLGVTVTAGTPTGQLYPGLTADGSTTGADLAVLVTNPNPFPVSVTLAAGTATTSSATGCTAGTVSFRGGTLTVPKGASASAMTVTKSVSMTTAAENPCQGATFTVPVTTTATSS